MNGFVLASDEFIFLVESLGLQDLLLVVLEFPFFRSGLRVVRSCLDIFFCDGRWLGLSG